MHKRIPPHGDYDHVGETINLVNNFNIDIDPKYSIISIGKNNRYGHQNKEVLDNLKHSKIYRTDQDGSIMFKINNNKLKIIELNVKLNVKCLKTLVFL